MYFTKRFASIFLGVFCLLSGKLLVCLYQVPRFPFSLLWSYAQQNQHKIGKVYFGLQFEGAVLHGEEVTGAVVWSVGHIASSVRRERVLHAAAQPPFALWFSLRCQPIGHRYLKGTTHFSMHHLTSIHLMRKMPHRLAQRFCFRGDSKSYK